jgi:formate hydrogenlyase subunit 3/multisubunit Na+/H+ antiporter MnhD subunit
MEGLTNAIQQPEYVHVLLNHLPITGLFIALCFLLAGILNNNRFTLRVALAAVVLLSFSAWPVAHYGKMAFDRVLSMSDDAGGQYLRYHEELADRWMFVFYVTAAAALAALILDFRRRRYSKPAAVLAALLAAGSLIAGAVIGDYGGKIRHREFRSGPPPILQNDSR